MESFAKIVDKGRKLRQAQDLIQKVSYKELARKKAIEVANKSFYISYRSKCIEQAFDVSMALGSGFVTSFLLEPYAGFIVGESIYGISKTDILNPIKQKILSTDSRLNDIISSHPGRIKRGRGGSIYVEKNG